MHGATTSTILLVLAAGAGPLRAVDLRVQFGALERMLAEQVFTEEGRRYVRGGQSTKCNFAYLEKPQIQGESGRLRIRARFTGRTALNMLGQCVGLGDAFSVTISATPQYRDGNVVLTSVSAASDGRTSFYIRRVCAALATSLGRDFKYPLASAAQKLLEDPGALPGYKRELRRFQVPSVQVASDALLIQLEFELTVK
jgi:hypothetical protein